MSNVKYKQTEVGVIPSDWELKELGTILTFGSGRDYKQLQNGEIPVYGTGGVMTYVDEFLYDGMSVGIGRKGTIDKPVFLEGKFWTVDTLFYTHQFINANPKFIYYIFCLIKWKEYNEASGVPSLNKNTLQKIKIAFPKIAEQTAIATALSDADALISSLEKLIAKKRNIKQGVMQQLIVNGELLMVNEKYIKVKLGDVCEFSSGTAHENFIDDKGNYIVVNSRFISTDGEVRKYSKTLFCPAKKDDILIVLSDVPNGKAIAKCFFVENENTYTVNQRIGIIKPQNINSKYLFYLLNRHKNLLAFDDGAKQTNLRNQDVLNLQLTINNSPLRQTAIAECLTDMDNEISVLESKLEKYKKVKLGMMQNLLTGKIRLIVNY